MVSIVLFIRPEHLRIRASGTPSANTFAGAVERVTFLGEFLDCRVRVGSQLLSARVQTTQPLRAGEPVLVELAAQLCTVMHERYGTAGPVEPESPPETSA